MKKSTKILLFLLAALFILVAVLAVVHNSGREIVPEGALVVRMGEETVYVDLRSQPPEHIHGTLINGKGEEKTVEAEGLSLRTVLELAGLKDASVNTVTARSDDEYSAVIAGDELWEDGKVYVSVEDDGSLRLIVFGDSNAKRQVKGLVSIDLG